MTPKFAGEIYEIISDSCCVELYMDVISKAVAYAHYRAEWTLSDELTQTKMRSRRTSLHNAFIEALNNMVSDMSAYDEPIGWFDDLKHNRQETADLACWIHYHLSLEA